MNANADDCWKELADGDSKFNDALTKFLKCDQPGRLRILRSGLALARPLTLKVLRWVPIEERKELFPDLLYLARAAHGYIGHVRELILSLPKEWLLERIERNVEPLLQSGNDEEFRRFLELYTQIDNQLAKRLAQRAVDSSDPNVRETGEEFMEKLDKRS